MSDESDAPSRPRGFALLTPEERRRLGRKGGQVSQATGHGHQFTPGEEARRAGEKGGRAIRRIKGPLGDFLGEKDRLKSRDIDLDALQHDEPDDDEDDAVHEEPEIGR